jgi:nucleoside-diphosphate-sugar epimerase
VYSVEYYKFSKNERLWVGTAGKKIVITGAAGLVGQNLVQRLFRAGFTNIVAIDKHRENAAVLQKLHPSLNVVLADLSVDERWEKELASCDALIISHAQIGGLVASEFVRNNIHATERLLKAAERQRVPYIVHISSSVVNSKAVDNYTETKKKQEALVAAFGLKHIILRPTLMFGWFDRKHLGWLARFMSRVPIFPVPGSGKYLRQPLYVGDFCGIIIASIQKKMTGIYNISGQERIAYIDLIKAVRTSVKCKTRIQKIPYAAFWVLLKTYALFDSNPPFTTKQLEALVTPDVFEVIDWPTIFGVNSTKLDEALRETFQDTVFSEIALAF